MTKIAQTIGSTYRKNLRVQDYLAMTIKSSKKQRRRNRENEDTAIKILQQMLRNLILVKNSRKN